MHCIIFYLYFFSRTKNFFTLLFEALVAPLNLLSVQEQTVECALTKHLMCPVKTTKRQSSHIHCN